ncbi:MAG: PPOX class probable F420-dependent enzyme [Acidimicrobiales bacterium]|jgi:PPOX class probable F420-dependent enzyme
MAEDEVAAFLAEPHLCTIGTIGPKRPGGAPNTVHLVAMNYGFLDGVPAFWTYKKAQKTRNLERDPSISMLVDTGIHYADLKGVTIQGRGELIHDADAVVALADSMAERYGGLPGDARASAPKRAVVRVLADKVLSWDHSKLGGSY